MNDPAALTLAPADLFRRAAAWLVDVLIVAVLFLVPFAAGLPRIEGCKWDPVAEVFPDECVFKTSKIVLRDDGTSEQVYVFDDGEEIPASTPTLQTALFGEFIIKDGPGPAAYLIPFLYILAMWVGVQGLRGWTPGKAMMGLRLANEEGRAPGVLPALIRWLVIDGAIGLLGLLVALVKGPPGVRYLAANGALGLIGGIYALVTSGRRTGDHAAHTLVIDETLFRRPERPEPELEPERELEPDRQELPGYRPETTSAPTMQPATAAGTGFGTPVLDEIGTPSSSPPLSPRHAPGQPDSGDDSSEPAWQPQPAPAWPPLVADVSDLPDTPAAPELPGWAATPAVTAETAPEPGDAEPVPVESEPALGDATPASTVTEAAQPGADALASAGFGAPPSFPSPPGVGDTPLGGVEPLAPVVPPTPAVDSATEAVASAPTAAVGATATATATATADESGATSGPKTVAGSAAPQWNEEREAWMMWDNDRQEWLQFDEEIGTWLHYDPARAVWVALQD